MKCKKVISGLLSFTIMATSVFTGDFLSVVKAAEVPAPIAVYSFNDESLNSDEVSGEQKTATAMLTGYSAYTDNIVYGEGRTGEDTDKSVNLGGNHGLVLPEENLGTSYTVSLWVNLTSDVNNFAPLLALGNDNVPKWMTVAGAWEGSEDGADDEQYIVWGTNIDSSDELHFSIPKNKWTMITVAQTGTNMTLYKDGINIGTMTTPFEILNGEGQGIHVGMNQWDQMFPGYVDDIQVWNTELSAGQIRYLYDGKGAEEVFSEEGFTVTSTASMLTGEQRVIDIKLPELIDREDAQITYKSEDESIATVENGVVTGVTAGETKIITTVVVGEITKSQETVVTVKNSENVTKGIAVEYDLTQIVDGKVVDKTGRGNDAIVQGESGISFTEEDGKTVMVMASNDSYLELPVSIMDSLTNKEQFTVETSFAKSKDCGNNAWLFCFGSNVKSTGTNYMFLSPNFDSKTLRAGIKNSSSEKLFGTSIQPKVDDWYTVNMVFDKGVVKLYWNGVLIQGDNGTKLDSGYSIMNDIVTPGTSNDILGYIGKSCWAADKNYQGKIASFKIYDKAMTDEEVQLSNPEYREAFQKILNEGIAVEDIIGNNSSADAIRYDMSLPETYNENDIIWECSNPDRILPDGTVKNGETDENVTLTATMCSGALVATKDFEVTVKAIDRTDLEVVIASAQKAIEKEYADPVSVAVVRKEIERANAASTQTEISNAIIKIEKAVNNIKLLDVEADPFILIDESNRITSVEIKAGETVKVFTLPEAIKGAVTVSYISSNPEIATVDTNGVVTGVKNGNANVIATVTANKDGFAMEYQTLVKVVGATTTTQIVTVTASVTNDTIVKGQSTQMTVVAPEGSTIKYRAKGAVAVTKTGKITGKKGGTGTVYAIVTVSGKTVTRKVTVKVGDISGKSTVKVKKSIKLSVTGISGKVKWSVNKKSLATISSKGVLKAKKNGKVIVTAKVGKYTIKKTITIKK